MSAAGLSRLVRDAAPAGVTVSTVGVGLGYNSELLAALADAGGGGFHYVENARSAEAALTAELFEAAELAARQVQVEVTVPAAAAMPVPNLNGYPQTAIPGGIRVALGDLARQRDLVVLVTTVDATGAGDTLPVTARVSGLAADRSRLEVSGEAVLRLVGADELEAAGYDPEVSDLVVRLVAAQAELQAAAHLEAGDLVGARAARAEARSRIRRFAPASTVLDFDRRTEVLDSMLEAPDPRVSAKLLHAKGTAARRTRDDVPFARSYWVRPGTLLAGCYPGDRDPALAGDKLRRLRAAGITAIVNLMVPGEVSHGGVAFRAYEDEAADLGMRVLHRPIPDGATVDTETMVETLDLIDAELAAGNPVFVHCWGGRGRTGTVVGCWLARHAGGRPADPVRTITRLRARCPDASQPSPENVRQVEMVETWPAGR